MVSVGFLVILRGLTCCCQGYYGANYIPLWPLNSHSRLFMVCCTPRNGTSTHHVLLRFLYQGREVSYSSVLAQSISKRRDALYKAHGFDIERWVELVGERKSLRREIGRIAEDYEERVAHDFEDEPADELDEGGTRKNTKTTPEDVVKDSLAKAEGKSEGKKEENIGRKMATKANREE